MMWNVWTDMNRLRNELDNLFAHNTGTGSATGEFPLVNMYTGEDAAILVLELPGVNPEELDITSKNNTLTIRGQREGLKLSDGEKYLRSERGAGKFVRSISLPFEADSNKIEAQYKYGILQIRVPRAEEDKPRKIAITAG